MNFQFDRKALIVAIMVVIAAMSRLLPHPPNFTPIGGMALFGAAYFAKKYWAFLIPLLALWISDMVLNNVVYAAYFDGFSWMGIPMVYAAMILIVCLGKVLLKKIKTTNILVASVLASTIFFLVTNLGSWWMDPIYPKTIIGVVEAYVAGIPFFWNTLAGDLFFSAVLFGGFELIKRVYPQLTVKTA